MSDSRAVKVCEHGVSRTESGRTALLLAENHSGRSSLRGNNSGAIVRVEPEKLAVGTISFQPSSGEA